MVKTLREIKLDATLAALDRNGYHRLNTARELDVSLSTVKNFIRELKAMGFNVPNNPESSLPYSKNPKTGGRDACSQK